MIRPCSNWTLLLFALTLAACSPTGMTDAGTEDAGAGDAGTPDAGAPDAGEADGGELLGAACGLPAIRLPTGGEACTQTPKCPGARSMTATTLVSLSTCGPLANESGCTPILVPECPSTGHRDFQFSVINGAKPDGCFSDLALSIEPTVNGGATVNWTATEKDPDSCMPVGSTITGSAVVPGACCSIQRDVRFPVSSFIFRLEVRTDWQ